MPAVLPRFRQAARQGAGKFGEQEQRPRLILGKPLHRVNYPGFRVVCAAARTQA